MIIFLAAGDVYIGTLGAAFISNYPLDFAMRLATYCAGTKCTKPGGASGGMPTLSEIPFELLQR